MRLSVGLSATLLKNSSLASLFSLILSTALVLIPVLPLTAASVRAASAGREGETTAPRLASAPLPSAALTAPLAPSLTATKVDSFPDLDGDNKAVPGETITYTVTITNNGPDDATNVVFNDTVDANTTLVPGSVSTQPIAANDSYNVLGNVRIQPSAAAGLLVNDCDPDNGPSCSSTGLTASGPTSSANGGDVVVNANGSFSYNPPAGFEGADSFTYTVTDPQGKTDTATVNFTVNEVVWFVDNTAAAGGDGRLTEPYNSLASLGGADLDEPFDFIFVHEGAGSYAGGIVLEDNQRLIGQGTALDAALAAFGVTAPAHSDARPAATSNPTLANAGGNVITLANGNAVVSVNASASAAASAGIFGSGVSGATVVSNTGVSASGSANGVSLSSLAGSLTMTNSTVSANSSGTAVLISGGATALSFNNTDVSQNGGRVIDIQNRTGGVVSFDAASSVTGTNGTTDAVSLLSNTGATITFNGPVQLNTNAAGASGLVADSGTLNMANGGNTVSSTGAAAVDIQNMAVNLNFATTFSTNSTGRGLRVDSVSGTASFGNTAVNGSANTGVLLTGNSAAVTFVDLDIAPAANQRALHALDNTGAISSTSGVIATTGATAVEIDGPAGETPLNVQLTSVSASGTGTGILVRDTSDGGNGFRVTGTLTTDGSGGVINNITSRGASFLNADDISLSNMTFTNVGTANGADPTVALGTCGSLRVGTNTDCSAGVHADGVVGLALTNVDLTTGAQQGVNGNNVTNFSMSDSNVSGFGDQTNESGLRFNNLLGTSSLSNVHVFNNSTTQVEIQNESGTLTSFNVSGSEFNHGGTTLGNGTDGMLFSAQGTAVMNIAITGSNFHDTFAGGFFSDSADSASMNIAISGSTFERFGSGAVNIVKANSSNVTFNITGNTIRDNGREPSGVGHAININKASPSTAGTSLQGTIHNNILGDYVDAVTTDPDTDDKGTAVRLVGVSAGALIATVSNNDIRDFRERGIFAQLSGDTSGNNSMAVNITNNTVNNRDVSEHGIFVNAGAALGDNGTLCANITGNNSFSGSNGIRGRANQSTTVILPGYAGLANDGAALNAFVATNNPATTDTISFAALGSGTMTGGAACSTPVASNTLFAEPPVTGGDMQTADAGSVTAPSAAAMTGFSFESAFVDMMRKVRSGFAYSDEAQPLGALIGTSEARGETPRAALSAAPVALAMAGETVNITIGTLRAGDSVTITFQVTVADPFPTNVQPPEVSNQGTVSGSNFASVLTDDPSEPGGADPTVTPILTPPTISVNDATLAEPATGTEDMLFTVTLSHAYTQTVTVNFQTANGGANPATAGTDYTTTNGTATFAAGETVQTVSVPVLADGTAAEGDEHFLVNLSAPTNGSTIDDGSATGTITDESTASQLIISELRTSGPGGSGDDFVELLNTTDNPITVTSSDASSGWSIVKSGTSCSTTPVVVGVIPNGTVIPARGNYLLTGSAYSLGAYGASNAALSADIEDDHNVGLFTVADLSNISSVNRLDAVGFGANTGNNCDLLREGNTLAAAAGSTSEYSFVRKVEKGLTLDTTDNAADFVVVSTTPSVLVGGNTPVLGAPGPEGLGSPRGPVPCAAPTGSALFGRDLIDPGVSVASAPNVVRDNTAVTNGALGTLDFRRTFTNNTGGSVTALRFRIIDLSTTPAGAGEADLRALSSSAIVVSTTGGNKTVEGTTVETPPAQPNGGGVNSTLAAGTITLGTPLADGASVNLRFLFGVQQTGDYDIAFVLESLPGSGKDFWKLSGHTETGGHTDGGCNKAPIADAGDDQTVECSGGQASVTLDGSGSTDPDGDTPLTYEWREGATVLGTTQTLNVSLPLGPHTITLKVTDPSGDFSEDTVQIDVVDTTDPIVTAPPDVTVHTGPGATSCSANVSDAALGTGSATDGCEGTLPVNRMGVPAGNNFPVGTTQVTYTATDASGNTGMAIQNVTVIDNTVPVVNAPPNITTSADADSCSAMVNPGEATATDNCAVGTIVGTRSDNQPLNAPYPVGTTTITWTATDVNGNQATAQQTVTVQDTQAPTLSSSVTVTTMGPPFNHALINVGLAATASDNCGLLGPFQVFVYSDEDDGPAPHSPDATNIGIGSLRLRRERDGAGDGRVYLIVVTVTDASGNTAVSVTTVTVPLSNSAGDQASVNAQAAAAAAFASANNGAAPAGYFAVGQ